MKDKIIDLNQTVYELCSRDEKLINVLSEIGFKDITKPGMLATAGRFMTIPKGAAMKKINLPEIKETLKALGYEVKE